MRSTIQNRNLPFQVRKRKVFDYVQPGFGLIAIYSYGRAAGDIWVGMKGDAYLHGKVDPNDSTITGDSILYIYPDYETAIIGQFKNRLLQSGSETEILQVGCNRQGLMVVTKFAKPRETKFWYEVPTNISQGSGPEGVADPYETKWLRLVLDFLLSYILSIMKSRKACNLGG